MKKLLITIAILSCAALAGCANSEKSEVSAESSASTTSAAAAQSTSATTTATTASTTAATTTATTTAATTTAETTASEAVEEIPEAAPELPTDPIADEIVQEREDSIPIATDEQVAQIEQDRKDRQDLADDTSAYTTDGIPLTTNGDLTEPAKPTGNYKLPDGAQLEFTGDPETAIYTELPEGCYWRPTGSYPNAFMDPAGNLWCNNQHISFTAGNRGAGYYTPDGDYHYSQKEIDDAKAFTNEMNEAHHNGPANDGTSNMTDEEGKALAELFGF